MTDVFSLKDFSFPEGFLWGSATAAHQIEGNNIHSNNWYAEQQWLKKDPNAEVSGMACNHYNMVKEDVALLKRLGHQAYRMGAEWARIQPEEGVFDKEATEHYIKELALLKENGIKVFLTLVHTSIPRWFEEKGDWQKQENYKYFETYLEYIVPKLAPYVDFWNVFNEFNLGVYEAALVRKFNCTVFHGRAYHLIRKYSSAPIGSAHAFVQQFGKRQGDKFDMAAQEWFDVLNHEFFFHAMRTGELVVPGVGGIYDRDMKDTSDFWSVNLYTRDILDTRVKGILGERFPFKETRMIPMNFYLEEFFPEAMFHCLNRLKDKPVYITENGVCADNDDFRLVWLAEYLSAVHEAIKAGVDVRGYLYWSLMDNWEWASWKPKFGLVSVDRENGYQRTPKPSAYFYKEIIENNGFKADILKKYLKEMPRLQDYKL